MRSNAVSVPTDMARRCQDAECELKDKCEEMAHLRQELAIADSSNQQERKDYSTGSTDYPSECRILRAEKTELRKRCTKLEQSFTKLSIKMAEMRNVKAHESPMPQRSDKSAQDHDQLCNDNECLK